MTDGATVTACLIVRNEERFLDGCLASIAGQVDEIVVVDTGSTDRTIDIAKGHGARLIEQAWAGDFAAARNTGLDVATSEWVLYIDADERLSLPEGGRLNDGLEPAAYAARVKFYMSPETTACREYRLFRNDDRLRFHGAMHETILPSLRRLQEDAGVTVIDSAAAITHLGYVGDITHKFRRNLPLLRAGIEREPERLYYWYDLARALHGLGEAAEAAQVAREAIARAQQSERASDRRLGAAAADVLCRVLEAEGRELSPAVDAGLALAPDHALLRFRKARILAANGELEAACSILEALCAVDPLSVVDEMVPYERRLFTQMAPHLLGTVLLRMGRVAEAAGFLSQAAKSLEGDSDYRRNAELVGAVPGG